MSSQCRGGWTVIVLILFSASSAHSQTNSSASVRKTPRTANTTDAVTPVVKVFHLEDQDEWSVARSANFHLFHQHVRALAEAVLRTAERTRATQQLKWFGALEEAWTPRCCICLYPSGVAYSETTGVPANPAGGHTDVRVEDGRVLSRYVHLHGPRDLLLNGVLPHEVTHAVLAGRLGGERVPRWADEGMAVLAEPQPRIDLHFRHLPRCRDDRLLFHVGELIQMRDYPEPCAIGAFYAQSVSLVDFLTREKGAKRFTAFVRDGESDGYATLLRRHYGWNFAELDRRWQRHAFPEEKAAETANGGGG